MSLCFKDRTFCAASDRCADTECHDKLTPELRHEADVWWAGWGHPDKGPPISIADYSLTCSYYVPIAEPAHGG